MPVIKQTAVTVDPCVRALLEHFGDAILLQTCRESRTWGVLDAMCRPERLRQTIQINLLEGLFARMICREAAVVSRMPILRRDHKRKNRLQLVRNRNYRVAVRDSQGAAGKEIVLDINQDERFHGNSMNCGGT